jgi:hypothetical protein
MLLFISKLYGKNIKNEIIYLKHFVDIIFFFLSKIYIINNFNIVFHYINLSIYYTSVKILRELSLTAVEKKAKQLKI